MTPEEEDQITKSLAKTMAALVTHAMNALRENEHGDPDLPTDYEVGTSYKRESQYTWGMWVNTRVTKDDITVRGSVLIPSATVVKMDSALPFLSNLATDLVFQFASARLKRKADAMTKVSR